MEPEEMEEEVMDEEMEVEVEEESPEVMISNAVAECFAEGGEAYEMGTDESIDAVIAKLEGMKTGDAEAEGGGFPGLGGNEGAMDLGEEVV